MLLGLWTSLVVNAATPSRRPRPNGARSRVTRSIPCTGHAHEAIEPLWGTACEDDLLVPVAHAGVADVPPFLTRPTYSGIAVGSFVATHRRLTVLLSTPPRGPPLASHYPLI